MQRRADSPHEHYEQQHAMQNGTLLHRVWIGEATLVRHQTYGYSRYQMKRIQAYEREEEAQQ